MRQLLLLALMGLVGWCWPEPCLGAAHPRAMLLVNMGSGRILYEHNADLQLAPASLTKIMTMYLAMDAIRARRLSLNQKIVIPADAARIGGSAMRLEAGEQVPVVRLLAGMAVASGNDAATALAMHLDGSLRKFAARMNAKARELGMKNTVFKNPTGLPAAGHKTTARDLMKLCLSYLRAHPQAARFHSMGFYMHKGMVAKNTNPLLGKVQGVDGLKTGWTVAAGYNLIVTARRGKTRLMAIVLGCNSKETREQAAINLLEAGFKYPDQPGRIRKVINGY